MKDGVKIALVQMACGPEREANIARAEARAREARDLGAELIALPELFATRYFAQERDMALFALAELVPGPTTERLAALAAELRAVVVGSLFEYVADGFCFNTAVVLDADGNYLGKSRKMHIPDYPLYSEKLYFTPGDTDYPVFQTAFLDLAVPTCWDQWFPEVARLAMLKGAELIVYPTAIGREPSAGATVGEAWQTVMRGHAVANCLYVAAVNRVGREDAQDFFGASFVADPAGGVIAAAGDGEEILFADLSRERLAEVRVVNQFLRDRRPETYAGLLRRTLLE